MNLRESNSIIFIFFVVLATFACCTAVATVVAHLSLRNHTNRCSVEHFQKVTLQQQTPMFARSMRVRKGQDKRIPACENKCESQQTQAESIIMFNPIASARPSTGQMVMCGQQNYNADVYVMTQLRQRMLDSVIDMLHNQDDFIIFFTKQNYQGRMFLFSAHEDVSWSMDPEEDIDPDNISFEKAMEQEEKDKKKEEEKDAPVFIDSKKDDDEQHTHTDVKSFLDEFSFEMGRKYSCIIPGGVEYVQVIPFDVTEKPSEGWTGLKLKSGKHAELTYNRARPAVFKIKSKKTSAGWEQQTFVKKPGGEWKKSEK